jgi:mannose-6-phosphate isomerase-like protein (cupin superfamily)
MSKRTSEPAAARGGEPQTAAITPAEMARRVVRFKDMPPRPKPGAGELPDEIVEYMTADANYSYMAPAMEGQSIIQRYAALTGGDAGDAISVSLAVCSPGRGPALHAHLNTVEAFFCLSGRFAIEWGARGEEAVELEQWDFIHVPKGVVRTFRNVGDTQGALLVIIQGPRDEFDDVVNAPYVAEQLGERFGPDAVALLEKSGRQFYAPTG